MICTLPLIFVYVTNIFMNSYYFHVLKAYIIDNEVNIFIYFIIYLTEITQSNTKI